MQDRTANDSSASAANRQLAKQDTGRNLWVVTAYAISGLALFGVLAYYVSNYIAR